MKFDIQNDHYEITPDGVIHQINPKPFIYDTNYISCYDNESYKSKSDLLQMERLTFVSAVHGRPIRSLIDYGYGLGDFMRFARKKVKMVYGFDLTRMHVEGCEVVNKLFPVDAITFHDALEHVPDISFIKDLPCETVSVSLPNCEYHLKGKDWFASWYHRKPGEHLHFFDEASLIKFMDSMGWEHKSTSILEDYVRERGYDWNILQCGFKRKI